jgi:hypothetical protein
MEELKLLIEAVAGLPTITLWVLVGYLIYKLAVIGSVYGVIRFGIEKFVQWKTTPKQILEDKTHVVKNLSITTDGTFDNLISQLSRLRGKGLSISSQYIHGASVDWLREAITEKELREAEKQYKKEIKENA